MNFMINSIIIEFFIKRMILKLESKQGRPPQESEKGAYAVVDEQARNWSQHSICACFGYFFGPLYLRSIK